MRKLFILFLLLYFGNVSVGQDPVFRLSKNQALMKPPGKTKEVQYRIVNETLVRSSNLSSILHDVIFNSPALSKKLKFSDGVYTLNEKFILDSCTYLSHPSFTDDSPGNDIVRDRNLKLNRGFEFRNSNFKDPLLFIDLTCKERKAKSTIEDSRIEAINIFNSAIDDLMIDHCDIENNVNLDKNSMKLFVLADSRLSSLFISSGNFHQFRTIGNEFSSGITILNTRADFGNISNSEIHGYIKMITVSHSCFFQELSISNNNCEWIEFENDSLLGIIRIEETDKKKEVPQERIIFKDCYIDARCEFLLNDSACHSFITFDHCTFGTNTTMTDMQVDAISFQNCTGFQNKLFLTLGKSRIWSVIEFLNTDVKNIEFDYADRFGLFFEEGVSDETKSYTYQSLVEKFRKEGKPESLERIDIEYKDFKYNNNIFTRIFGFIDSIWWNYGYSKWMIIGWTLLFLTLFFGYNYSHWNEIRGAFEGITDETPGTGKKSKIFNHEAPRVMLVLFYTTIIFFSLRIDFDKLKQLQNKYLAAFFIQYLVGLVCLFFLVNAIFKL